MTSAAILDSVLHGKTGNMAKDKEKNARVVWTEQEEDVLMDLFEDNEGLYKTGEKAYSKRPYATGTCVKLNPQTVKLAAAWNTWHHKPPM